MKEMVENYFREETGEDHEELGIVCYKFQIFIFFLSGDSLKCLKTEEANIYGQIYIRGSS